MGDCYISRRSSQTIGEQGYTYIWTKLESNEITVRPLILHLVPAISPSHADTLCHF